jgi:hypothetical protein
MQTVETTTLSPNSTNAVLAVVKYAYRNFPPKTKFRSLFGATDIVSDRDEVRVDKFGECYILCNSGQWRLIYNGKYWADVV